MTSPRLRLASIALLSVLLAVCATPTRAQTAADALFFSQRLPATGPRLTALGGASLAGIADYGALYSNPAGLGYFEMSEVGGTFRMLLTTDETTYETFDEDGSSFGANRFSQSQTGYGLGNAALVYKVATQRGSFVFSGAVNTTRVFDRQLDFRNQNELSSISDFFLPLNNEVSVQQFAPGEGPTDLFFGQELIIGPDDAEYLVDFDPDGDGFINRPLSFAAFQTFGIDFAPGLFDGSNGAAAFLPVVSPGTQFQQVGDISEDGALREVNLGSAFEASKGVMLGFSANITFGSYAYTDLFEEIDTQNQNDGTNGTVDFQRLRLTRSLDSDFGGFSLRGGLSADVTENVRLGFTIETPTWYSIEETSNLRLLTDFDNGDRFVYGDDPAEDAGRTRFDYEIRTPWRLGGGLSVHAGGLRFLVDAVFVDWTQLKLDDEDETGFFDPENNVIEDTFDPVVNTRVGLEYNVSDLALRAGFAYQPSPVTFSELGAAQFGVGTGLNLRGMDAVNDPSRYTISAGIGYVFNDDLTLDVTWAQERFEDRTLPYTAPNASFVNEEVVRNRLLLGLRYRF